MWTSADSQLARFLDRARGVVEIVPPARGEKR
jgi:hypothetical protein